MSIPPNPLDKYRSHSVNYVLLVSNSTEALKGFTNPSGADQQKFLADVASKQLGEAIGGNSYILVDSRRTSEFSISHIEIESHMGGSTPSQTTILLGLIKMTLVDPSGIGFFNYLKYLLDVKLKTDASGLVFLLNISFLGHTDSNTTEPIPDGNITIPMNMTGVFSLSEFTTRGGVYNMEFTCSTGTMGNPNSPFVKIPSTINYKAKDSLLGEAIQSFENLLNNQSRDYYKRYNPIDKEPGVPLEDKQVKEKKENNPKKNGRLVQYMITIPPEWFQFHLPGSAGKIKEIDFAKNEQIDPKTSTEKADSYHSTMNNDTIQNALIQLLNLSSDVTNLGGEEQKKKGTAKTYKILTSLTSDDDTVIVHFDIVEYDITDPNTLKQPVEESQRTTTTSIPSPNSRPEGAIEFDFIFSGKNADVLNFDIRIDNLLMGLQSRPLIAVSAKDRIITTNQKAKDPNDPLKKDTDIGTINFTNANTPCIPPPPLPTSKDNHGDMPNRNEKDYDSMVNDRLEFHKTLANLQVATMQPILKIRGNPSILTGFTVDSIAPHIKMSSSAEEFVGLGNDKLNELSAWEYKTGNRNEPAKPKAGSSIAAAHVDHRKFIDQLTGTGESGKSANDSTKRMLAVGQYVKVNVYGPRDYPFSQEAHIDDMYRVKLFYDGWYMVSQVIHTFDGANFTQDLTLYGIDTYGEVTVDNNKSESKKPQN